MSGVVQAFAERAETVLVNVPEELATFVDAATAAITPEVTAAVANGDTEGATRMLWDAVAPQSDIEEAVE